MDRAAGAPDRLPDPHYWKEAGDPVRPALDVLDQLESGRPDGRSVPTSGALPDPGGRTGSGAVLGGVPGGLHVPGGAVRPGCLRAAGQYLVAAVQPAVPDGAAERPGEPVDRHCEVPGSAPGDGARAAG